MILCLFLLVNVAPVMAVMWKVEYARSLVEVEAMSESVVGLELIFF